MCVCTDRWHLYLNLIQICILFHRGIWSSKKTLQSSEQYSSKTPFFVPVPRPPSSSQQPKNRGDADRPSAWLPMETIKACLPIPPQRSALETVQLREALINIFPDDEQRQKIDQILADHPFMRDLNALSAMVLDWTLYGGFIITTDLTKFEYQCEEKVTLWIFRT